MDQNGATSVEYGSKRKKQSKKKKGGQKVEAGSQLYRSAIPEGDHEPAEDEVPTTGTGLEDTVEKMALEDGPRKQVDDSNNSNNSNSKAEHNKSGNVNGGMGDSGVMKELLVKQQERTKELEDRLKQMTQEWNTQKSELQKDLKEAKQAHERDLAEAYQRHAKVEDEKRQLSEQYKSLLDKVATLKERMGEKLKADADALAEARNTAIELEEQNMLLTNQLDDLRTEYRKLNEESTDAIREAANLRNRLNISQQNWVKEREELIAQEKHLYEEYETTKQAMQDWEVIAMEERSMRESLADRVVELEEQLTTFKTGYEKAISERDRESATIDGLQRALREIQEARKAELKEIIENMQGSIDQLTEKSQAMEQCVIEAEAQLAKTREDLERFQQFEKEVKEKNLLIGKLRHEAVTLNDHLTKALRMLKKGNASDNVDKQLVSNVFLSFLSIQRGDAKKFEVLQLIASVLDWNDEQRERAGLARPGTSSNQNTLPTPQGSFSRASSPLMPYHRTPSTPSLSDPYEGSRELWSSVLDSPQTPSSSAKPF